MEKVLKQIDKAIELNTQLRIDALGAKQDLLEEKAYEIHSILCQMHDEISLLKAENEIGVSDLPPQNGALPLVGKSECEATVTDEANGKSEHGTLENRIDFENFCVCLKPEFYEYKPNNTIICIKCTKLHITHINEEIIA